MRNLELNGLKNLSRHKMLKTSLFLSAIFCLFGCVLSEEGPNSVLSHVVKLNTEKFDDQIPKKHSFVMFYAPWCGHCQRLKPTWEELATKLAAKEGEQVAIAQVDCTVDTELCSKQDVTGYPTLKLFKMGSTETIKYRGPRDISSLENFIAENLGITAKKEAVAENLKPIKGAVELTDENFVEHTASGDHFVKFYAPWCGHCQKLAPTWESLAQSVEHDPTVSVAKVDCTQHRTLCNDFDIKGYPTLLWIHDGKKVEKYQGSRSHEDLKAFIEKMKGTGDNEVQDESDDGKVPAIVTSPVVQLVESNFANGIATGLTFIKFYAPWCGHCKRMAPTWDELGTKFVGNSQVKIAKVDCTDSSNRQLCADQKVNGFPTMFLYRSGQKVEEYDGNRSLEDMYSFVMRNLKHDEL